MHQLVNMAVGEWNPQKIEREMKSYSALEMPLPPETLGRNPHLRNDDNQKRQILNSRQNHISYTGPEKASRITIRSMDLDQSLKIMENLKIRLKDESKME